MQVLWSGFFAGLITLLLVNFLKSYFDVPRPAGVLDINSFNIIGPMLKKRAFPSGHTATIFTLVGILGLYLKSAKIKIILLNLGLLVGFSRIAVGAHWPSDILFGISIGLISSLIAYSLVQNLKIKSSTNVDLIFAGMLLFSAIYFITFYDSSLQEVFLLQLIFGMIFLLKLSFDLFILIKNKRKNP
jgi:membrane-associated phospholipid phosphatase